jgi:hypothetical protein
MQVLVFQIVNIDIVYWLKHFHWTKNMNILIGTMRQILLLLRHCIVRHRATSCEWEHRTSSNTTTSSRPQAHCTHFNIVGCDIYIYIYIIYGTYWKNPSDDAPTNVRKVQPRYSMHWELASAIALAHAHSPSPNSASQKISRAKQWQLSILRTKQ